MIDATSLRFGQKHGPDGQVITGRALWGARLIESEVAAGGNGIVWDHTDCIGDDESRQRLLDYLNTGGMGSRYEEALREYLPGMSYKDQTYMVFYHVDSVADPMHSLTAYARRSGGYMYVCIVLDEKGW